MSPPTSYDLVVIGGGVNGCGIARDAAGRGLSVLLVEAEDLAGATSSASSKLIHGGLRYLERFDFRLVREALAERSRLLAAAPHLVEPLRFVLAQTPSLRRAAWMRLGLFLYDHLAGRRQLPPSQALRLGEDPYGAPLRAEFSRGFAYSDCRVDDSRLVALIAVDARERGAQVRTRARFAGASRANGAWSVQIESAGRVESVVCRALVNAAGPWVGELAKTMLGHAPAARVRLVKGSHCVLPRLYEGDHAYVLQNADRRIVFALPFEGAFTLIGTTDVPFAGDPRHAAIDADEIAYLCASVNRYFRRGITPADIVATFSGVRPLHDDGAKSASAVTRDYAFELNKDHGAPLLSIYGGKITTFRALAERACDALAPWFAGARGHWTGTAVLPGGDLFRGDMDGFIGALRREKPFLGEALARRLARAYGTRVRLVLGNASSMADLGRDFGYGLTEAEVDYLRAQEWALTAQDVLWRRSKLGLRLDAAAQEALRVFLGA